MFAVLQDKTKFKKRAFDGGRPTGPNLGEMAEDGGGDGGDGGGRVPILSATTAAQRVASDRHMDRSSHVAVATTTHKTAKDGKPGCVV